jgi:hypothetical protein
LRTSLSATTTDCGVGARGWKGMALARHRLLAIAGANAGRQRVHADVAGFELLPPSMSTSTMTFRASSGGDATTRGACVAAARHHPRRDSEAAWSARVHPELELGEQPDHGERGQPGRILFFLFRLFSQLCNSDPFFSYYKVVHADGRGLTCGVHRTCHMSKYGAIRAPVTFDEL